MKKLIAVTGGIGSGKSKVMEIIESLGFPTISCDEVTNKLYKKQSVLRKIKKIIPSGIKGNLFLKPDKKRIADVIFNDKNKYAEFTEFLTILTLEKTLKLASKLKGLVFIEVPLLFEFNAESYFDKIIVVTRELNTRIESVKTRSNLSEEQIKERIKSQYDYENNDLTNYIVINNDGMVDDLKTKVIEILEQLKTDLY
ncbi:MAG: dephospho-CoA kinase [Clostridia bacterium]|nr:dephospho-CoA kinase [Clostridia bacterium]